LKLSEVLKSSTEIYNHRASMQIYQFSQNADPVKSGIR